MFFKREMTSAIDDVTVCSPPSNTWGTKIIGLARGSQVRPTMRRARRSMLVLISTAIVVCHCYAFAQAPPGFWRGQGSTERVSDLRWINLIVHYDSDFSFTTDRNGNVDGKATVRYTLTVDDGRLRELLSASNSVSGAGLRKLPDALGSFVGGATKVVDLQGLKGSYNGGTVIRQGRIIGHLQGKQLHLEWASAPPTLPYTIYKMYPFRREVFRKDTGPAYSAWIMDATVSEPSKGHWEAVVPGSTSRKKTGTTVWTIVWSAHQEPAVQ